MPRERFAQPAQTRQLELDPAPAVGRRIRWERHPEDDDLLVVRDADSGEIIATVSSLLDLDWQET
jgi:hypothetical protein